MYEKEKPRLSRLTAILIQLQSRRIVTAKILADKYQVSIRTIYRDIRTLEKSGIPIITEEGKGYSLMKGYQLPPVMFTENEANALITAEHLINGNKDQSLIENYNNAVTKIKSILKYSQKQRADLLTDRIHLRTINEAQTTSNYLMTIQSAITQFTLLKIEYFSLQNALTNRKVEPFALYSTKDNWLLIAFCRTKNDFRTFRLDRIKDIVLMDESFSPHNITLQEYFEMCKKNWSTPDTPLT